MSVHTHLQQNEIDNFLASAGMPRCTQYRPIHGGITNSNFALQLADNSAWVLTLFENQSAEDLPFLFDYLSLLQAQQLPVPLPVLKDGQWLWQVKHKAAVLVPMLPGVHIDIPSTEQAGALGEAVGKMHQAVLHKTFGARENHRQQWLAQQQNWLAPLNEADKNTVLKIMRQYELQAALIDSDLPAALLHSDLFRDNVLFEGNAVSGILDFYDACSDYLIYDLAVIFNDWFHVASEEQTPGEEELPARVLWPEARAFFAAYQRRRAISATEKAFFPVAVQAAAMRFFLTRTRDEQKPRDTHVLSKPPGECYRRMHSALLLDEMLQEVFA